jgi:hypothetical protein
MLEDVAGIRRVVIACGYVDLCKGFDVYVIAGVDIKGKEALWLIKDKNTESENQDE